MKNKKRRILVTSGGTSEPIDSVRKITNVSTGRLGSLVGECFLEAGAFVDYITTKTALRPENENCQIYTIESTRELLHTMEDLLNKHQYDGVIHAMAVSDYYVDFVSNLQTISGACEKGIDIVAEENRVELLIGDEENKISSSLDNLVLVLRPTPKVIHSIKNIQPDTLLFGFKLLVGTGEDALVKEALRVMEKNKCDYMVANDLNKISGDSHTAFLISKAGEIKTAYSKQEIAKKIVETATLYWEENNL